MGLVAAGAWTGQATSLVEGSPHGGGSPHRGGSPHDGVSHHGGGSPHGGGLPHGWAGAAVVWGCGVVPLESCTGKGQPKRGVGELVPLGPVVVHIDKII